MNGGIRNQNQDCVTPKSSPLSTPPGYLHNTRLEIRPITLFSVSLGKSQLLSASCHLQDKRISVADLQSLTHR